MRKTLPILEIRRSFCAVRCLCIRRATRIGSWSSRRSIQTSCSGSFGSWGAPKKSALQCAIGAIGRRHGKRSIPCLCRMPSSQTSSRERWCESTATDADILEPSDSRLLSDTVRVPAAPVATGATAAAGGDDARPMPRRKRRKRRSAGSRVASSSLTGGGCALWTIRLRARGTA